MKSLRARLRSFYGSPTPQGDPTECRFFSKLLPEIRLLVYHELLSSFGDVVHIRRTRLDDGEFKFDFRSCLAVNHLAVTDWEEDYATNNYYLSSAHLNCLESCLEVDRVPRADQSRWPKTPRKKQNAIIELMLTCSRAKREVEHELYSNLTFILNGEFSFGLRGFFDGISMTAFSSISTLKLQFSSADALFLSKNQNGGYEPDHDRDRAWESLWELLRSASNLQTLHLTIFHRQFRLCEKTYLQPLESLQVPKFTVQLPWARDYQPEFTLESDEGHSFKVLRPLPEQVQVSNNPRPLSGGYCGRTLCSLPGRMLNPMRVICYGFLRGLQKLSKIAR